MRVGTVVKLKTKCLENKPGTKGVCFESDNTEKEEGGSLIFENGRYGKFSFEEQKKMFIPLGFNEVLMDYKFKNNKQLEEDFSASVFDVSLKTLF